MPATTLLLSARPPFVDEWHDLPATTARLGALLTEIGVAHETVWTLGEAIGRLPATALLVTNLTGRPGDPDPLASEWDAAITAFADRGGSVLGVHSSSIAFAASPAWEAVLGGTWVPGVSGHPPIGNDLVTVQAAHPVTAGLDDFRLFDERYTGLRFADDGVVLVSHEHDGERHSLVTVRRLAGGGHAVYDALGHGTESYDSPEHRRLLGQAVRWALETGERS